MVTWMFVVVVLAGSGSVAGVETYRFPDPETCEYVRTAFVQRPTSLGQVTPCREVRGETEAPARGGAPRARPGRFPRDGARPPGLSL